MSTSAPPALTPEELTQRLRTTLSAAGVELKQAGELQRFERLQIETRRPRESPPLVVITGEANTGKSSLVNALLGRPGLSPVDFDIATGACLLFTHAEQETACVHLFGELEPLSIAAEDVDQWANVEHNPSNMKGVRCVEIGLDIPLLRSMTLVDTPGSGGLDAGHASLALAAMRDADALIFTTDAAASLAAPELRFLKASAERIETVILVLTRTDLMLDWEIVERDNLAALRAKAPRFADCPRIAVSSLHAERALQLPDDADRAALLAESGIPTLERSLRTLVAARPGATRLTNAVRYADSSLRTIEAILASRLAADTADPAVKQALERERERLHELQREKASWNRQLDTRLRKINLDRADAVTRGITEIRVHYDALSNEKREDELAELPGQMLDDVSALADRIAAETTAAIREVVTDILGEIDGGSAVEQLIAEAERVTVNSDMHLGAPLERSTTPFDRLTMLQSWSSGRALGGYAVSLPALAIGGVPLLIASFAVASVFAWKAHGGRKLLTRQADFRGWLREQLLVVQTELNNEFSRKMIDLQPTISDAIREYLTDRETEVTAMIKSYENSQARDAEERARSHAEIKTQLTRVRTVLAQTTELLGILRAAHG